jgi:hypothetical protein
MPEPIKLPPPAARELAAWRKEFETRGREAIRLFVYGYGGKETFFFSDEKHQAAVDWLRKKEIADERRAAKTYHYLKWTLDAAIAAAVLALIGVLWVTGLISRLIAVALR